MGIVKPKNIRLCRGRVEWRNIRYRVLYLILACTLAGFVRDHKLQSNL